MRAIAIGAGKYANDISRSGGAGRLAGLRIGFSFSHAQLAAKRGTSSEQKSRQRGSQEIFHRG
jgi:hypothetical protein